MGAENGEAGAFESGPAGTDGTNGTNGATGASGPTGATGPGTVGGAVATSQSTSSATYTDLATAGPARAVGVLEARGAGGSAPQ